MRVIRPQKIVNPVLLRLLSTVLSLRYNVITQMYSNEIHPLLTIMVTVT